MPYIKVEVRIPIKYGAGALSKGNAIHSAMAQIIDRLKLKRSWTITFLEACDD